ncbi:MAG: 3-oxoacyl-ACP reductase FabG [Gammaproteobacteria bacterium]
MLSLKGKVALVTGASRGIGHAIAIQLGTQGATVIGTATTQAGADKITHLLQQQGCPGEGLVFDVAKVGAAEQLIATLHGNYEVPTILVNNAGVTCDNLLLRMKDEEWNAVMDTNLNGVYRITKACLKGMLKARWGRIISLGSVVGASGNPGQCNYVAAKAGLVGFSKSLAQELGSRSITVNVVAPGFIDTDMTRQFSEAQQQLILEKIPLQRLGKPEEIAYTVGFLASHAAAYITGETIHINGGMYMD